MRYILKEILALFEIVKFKNSGGGRVGGGLMIINPSYALDRYLSNNQQSYILSSQKKDVEKDPWFLQNNNKWI